MIAAVTQGSFGGELRQVTALFYDVVSSTNLLNRLDPEEFMIFQRSVHTEAMLAVSEHGGYLDQTFGDGGCAYFGYPVPAEDAAFSAVSAALDIVRRCRSLATPGPVGEALRLRVGLATSLVVLSGKRSVELPGDGIAGVAPALASRIQNEAEPNSVLVADATYQLTRSAFDFEPIGERLLKGFDAPQVLWRAVAKRSVEDRFSALRRPEAPLIARQDELELCRRGWASARAGRGQVVVLGGEAGIGKSRLVAELRQEAAGSDCDVRVFQCQPRGNARPLYPFLDRLRRELPEGGTSNGGADAVRAYLGAKAPGSRAGTAEMLADLLGTSGQAGETLSELSAEEFRPRAIAAGLDVITAWSGVRPQMIVVEDLHWADTLTEGLLAALVETVGTLRVLLLVTTRGPPPAPLAGGGRVLSLSLSRLDGRAVPELVGAIWRPEPLPAGLPAFVQEKSEGVPLFVEELTHLLKRRLGAAEAGPADWERVLRKEGISTLKDLLAARLADLGEARRVAQIAGAIGREFPRDLLSRVAGGEGIDAARLDALLDGLVASDVVHERAPEDRTTFRFHHVLLQEAAYDSLLKSELRRLHDRIVDAARDPTLPPMPDELLSWHCEQAGRPLEAAELAIRAAEASAARSAMREAERLLAAAERNLAACGPGRSATDLTLRLLMTRGAVATALYGEGSPEACAAHETGVALCRTEGEASRERFFPLYWGWWFTAANFGTQRMRSQVLLGDFETASDPEVRLQSFHCAWATHFHTGQHAECLRCVREGLRLYDPARAQASRVRYGGHDARSCALGERGLSLWFMGDDAAATDCVDAAVRWAEETEHLGSLSHALEYAVTLARYRNDHPAIAALAARLAEIGATRAMPSLLAKAKMFGGWARALTVSPADGSREFEDGLNRQKEIGTEESRSIYLDMRSELLAAAGDVEAAVEVLNEAVETFERVQQVFWLPELYRRRALLRKALGANRDDWLGDLRTSLSLAEGQGAATLAARARADLERLGADPASLK